MPVVFEHEQIQSRNQPVGGVARGQVDLMIFQRPRQQAQIHDARLFREVQPIGCSQTSISIGPLHELVAESGAPLRSERGRLRQSLDVQAARILAANLHRKSIVEAEGWPESQTEAAFVFTLDPLINVCLFATRMVA